MECCCVFDESWSGSIFDERWHLRCLRRVCIFGLHLRRCREHGHLRRDSASSTGFGVGKTGWGGKRVRRRPPAPSATLSNNLHQLPSTGPRAVRLPRDPARSSTPRPPPAAASRARPFVRLTSQQSQRQQVGLGIFIARSYSAPGSTPLARSIAVRSQAKSAHRTLPLHELALASRYASSSAAMASQWRRRSIASWARSTGLQRLIQLPRNSDTSGKPSLSASALCSPVGRSAHRSPAGTADSRNI